MKIKENKAFATIDAVIAIIAIIIFSGLIITLMHNNALENIKMQKEALAMVYLTEACENIAIADYDEVTVKNIDNFKPSDLEENKYNMNIEIIEENNLKENQNEDLIKKIKITISYKLVNKEYSSSIERHKIKE